MGFTIRQCRYSFSVKTNFSYNAERWANTTAGECGPIHVAPILTSKKTLINAAQRRLLEELGLTAIIEERLIVEYSADVGGGLWERERVHMFRSEVVKDEIQLNLNPNEVAEAKWITALELRKDMLENPTKYTPWFRIYMNHYPDLNF